MKEKRFSYVESSSRRNLYKNIIEINKKYVYEFKGESIPGVIRVLSKDSANDWEEWSCVMAPNCKAIIWHTDVETGKWLNSKTWATAVEELKKIGFSAPPKTIVRRIFPNIAKCFDEVDFSAPSKKLLDLLEEEVRLNKEVNLLLQKARRREEEEKLQKRNDAIKKELENLKKSKLSVEELKTRLKY